MQCVPGPTQLRGPSSARPSARSLRERAPSRSCSCFSDGPGDATRIVEPAHRHGCMAGVSTETSWRRRFPTPRWRVAGPLAIVVAAVIWAAAASIGGAPRRDAPRSAAPIAAGAGQTTAPTPGSTAPSEAKPSSSSAPALDLFGRGPLPSVQIPVRTDGVRLVDLQTGRLGPAIGTSDWRSSVLQLPDGSFLCVCATLRYGPAIGEQTLSLTLDELGVDGKTVASNDLGSWSGSREPGVAADRQGDSVSSGVALSPDGRLLAIGVAVRQPPVWRRT